MYDTIQTSDPQRSGETAVSSALNIFNDTDLVSCCGFKGGLDNMLHCGSNGVEDAAIQCPCN